MHGLSTDNKQFYFDFKLILGAFAGFILICLFFFYDQSAFQFSENSIFADAVICFISVTAGAVGVWLYRNGLLKTEHLIWIAFLCGFALRLGYALKFGYYQNQHDVESLNSDGHLSYIYYIVENLKLPQSNEWQFSHPPLHHILSAVLVKFSTAIGFSLSRSFENVQLLTVMYSSLLMPIGVEICRQCKIKGKTLLFCAVLLSFHPTFFILAGSINNDILALLLSMLGVLYLVKWFNSQSLKLALLCGLFIGLAMMTKVSAALIAVIAAVTVIIKFIMESELKLKSVVLQACVFLAVMLPLGLWHPIRNYILFEQPLGYVAPLPITNPLYNGDISLFYRLGISFENVEGIYVDVWEENNIWLYLLRNSLFGEYNFGKDGIALFCVLANAVLILLSFIALLYITVKIKDNRFAIPVAVLYAVQLIFFIYFNIKYPFGCSMDFRYIVPLLFAGIVFLGITGEKIKDNCSSISLSTVSIAEISIAVLAFGSTVIML